MATTKKARYLKAVSEGFDHILKFFETEELSQLTFAIECFHTAQAQSYGNKERFFAGRMRTIARLLAA